VLPVHCTRCGKPVALFYRRGDEYLSIKWSCPHDGCGAVQSLELKGQLLEAPARIDH
jgi:hypothetical protein